MSRTRKAALVAGSLAATLLVLALLALVTVRSSWFRERVKTSFIETVEQATGGRAAIDSFSFDWHTLRLQVNGLTLRGTEPASKPPLFHADSAAVGLKIISVLDRRVNIEYLDVAAPRVYLMIGPDGKTNIPEPKVRRKGGPNAIETVLNLAVNRFALRNGVFEIESQGSTPFNAEGRNLQAKFTYDASRPRYAGSLSVQPLELRVAEYAPTPVAVEMTVGFERNRIEIAKANLRAGESTAELSGAIEDLTAPHGSFKYLADVAQQDVAHFLRTRLLESGRARVAGTAVWNGGSDIKTSGKLNAYGVNYRDKYVNLRNFRADGALSADANGVVVSGLRFSGDYVQAGRRLPVDGRIADTYIRPGGVIDFRNLAVASLGGTFQGQARLVKLDRFNVKGDVAGFQARRVVAVYSTEQLPWDGRASGPVEIEGSFRRPSELRISADLAVTPEAGSAPVNGRITANYNARNSELDLGQSNLHLPSSQLDFSGVMGRQMRVRLETRDLNDVLPVLGKSAASAPLALRNGSVLFEGVVAGPMDNPRITGSLNATRFEYSGRQFDSLTGRVTAAPDNVRIDNAVLTRGSLRAQFQGAVALTQWGTAPGNAVYATGSLRNASIPELTRALELQAPGISGTLNSTVQVTGSYSDPSVQADVEALKGEVKGEPFDRIAGQLRYTRQSLQLTAGQIAAGSKRIQVTAQYAHSAADFGTGRLNFDISTNRMPLEQIALLRQARPGITGAAEATARGTVSFTPPAGNRAGYRIENLNANIVANGLQFTGQPLGDARLTANSEGGVLRAHLESDFARSTVRGDGSWKLEGDYPGSATVTFSRLDLGELRAIFAPKANRTVGGVAEGSLRIEGPALRSNAQTAELRLSRLEIGPANNGGAMDQQSPVALRNQSPIMVKLANGVATIESAVLSGRGTELTISGKALLNQKNALDLRINGVGDLALLKDFVKDMDASGNVTTNATVRGAPADPQINGRMEVQNASLTLANFPNGVSNLNGTISFTGDRATIDKLTGTSGGGEVALTGFLAYRGSSNAIGLHLEAKEVRVRYPEGVSTVANASLDLTGTPARSTVGGTITILRTGFNPQSDFSGVLTRSAEPIQTPAARTGLLGGMNFDVQIQTAPQVEVQSALTQDIEAEANLRLRGTYASPNLQGRVSITQGQVVFLGTKYNISQGSINFFNPVKIEPVFNVDLETRAKGIDVMLNIAGPLGKVNLTSRSDPPLQFEEIVALLATGQTPTSDPTLLARQSTSPQSYQQMGASALLGEAIASTRVAGTLQHFFGVSRLRIDPTLPGVQYNPQARLTLEQQITRDITFTYITVVNSSNPQVVSIQWNFSKQWSMVAVREENGLFGVDFYYKRQFD